MTARFEVVTSNQGTKLTLIPAVVFILPVGLSGCMLDRILEVRGQFCDCEHHFDVEFGTQPSIVMAHPVLLDQDVLLLLGAGPTKTVVYPEGNTVSWVFQEVTTVPDSANDLRFDLDFRLIDGYYLLQRISVDPKLNDWQNLNSLDQEALLSSARQICSSGVGFRVPRMEFDLPETELEHLPVRSEVLASTGPPHEPATGSGGWGWRFRIEGSNDDRQTARFTVWFDEFTQKPRRMESQYWRYRGEADFAAKKLSVNIDLRQGEY